MVFLQGQGKQTGGVLSFKTNSLDDGSVLYPQSRCFLVSACTVVHTRAEYGVKLVMFTGNKKPH